MSGLRAGKPALVIGASTDYGKRTLIGKVVNLIERIVPVFNVATGLYMFEQPITGKKKVVTSDAAIWCAQRDGYRPMGMSFDAVEGQSFTILEKYLMPLDENDPELIDIFKMDDTTVMSLADAVNWSPDKQLESWNAV